MQNSVGLPRYVLANRATVARAKQKGAEKNGGRICILYIHARRNWSKYQRVHSESTRDNRAIDIDECNRHVELSAHFKDRNEKDLMEKITAQVEANEGEMENRGEEKSSDRNLLLRADTVINPRSNIKLVGRESRYLTFVTLNLVELRFFCATFLKCRMCPTKSQG